MAPYDQAVGPGFWERTHERHRREDQAQHQGGHGPLRARRQGRRRARRPARAWPRAAASSSTRSSRTTGPSCWARSPCTRSSCCWPPASSCRSTSSPRRSRSSTTAATSRCDGQWVSEAYRSTVNISFDVRGGLLVRQMHHWAADIFIGSIIVHMARIFFTGAFRKPRELNWTHRHHHADPGHPRGLHRLLAARRPDLGHRACASATPSPSRSRSSAATWSRSSGVASSRATGIIIPRFFIIHVLIIPLVLIGLLSAHLGLLVRQKHTQFAGEGRTEHNVVGSPMFPTFMAKTTGLPLHGDGGHGAARGLRPDQPDLAVRLRTTRPRSPTPCSPTGTWAGSTARCASCRPGSSPAGATPSPSRSSCPP